MSKTVLLAAATAAAMSAMPASAAVIFTSTFENVAGGPSYGTYTTVQSADGWTAGSTRGIELQNHVAGSPAADGGNVFVELDTTANSSMYRMISAGTYDLSFLYSPRPGVSSASNKIGAYFNGLLVAVTGTGGAETAWTTVSTQFTAATAGKLEFRALGTSDSFGGYIDNISLSGVPEPATWGMMILGFGLVGGALRTRRRSAAAIA